MHLPSWSIDLIRRRERSEPDPHAVWLLVRTVAGRQIIAGCCQRAVSAGVRIDMTLAHARALWGNGSLYVHPYQPERDERALGALAAWATRLVPLVAVDRPDGLLMDISGCQRMYRGEMRLLNTIGNRLKRLGFQGNLASSATFGCARAVARYGGCRRCMVPDGQEAVFLSPLPVQALGIDDDCIDALGEVGVERIGQVLDLPRLELDARYGSDLLLRIDQALGTALETIDPVRVSPPPRVERTFDGPVKQVEVIGIAVRQLLDDLARQLEQRQRGVCRLDLEVERADTWPIHETLTLSRPSCSGAHLWTLLRSRVEMLHMGLGVERIALTATKEGRLLHEQVGCWSGGGNRSEATTDRSWDEMIDMLVGRLGPQRMMHLDPVASHVPERAFARRPVLTPRAGTPGDIVAVDRPTLILDRPEPVEVLALTPGGSVCRLHWRGAEYVVVDTVGPERIAMEWWRETDKAPAGGKDRLERHSMPLHRARDYFKVQDASGRWLWLFHQLETGRWFVHGQWA